MNPLTIELLHAGFKTTPAAKLQPFLEPLLTYPPKFGIDTAAEYSTFLSQMGHETQRLTRLEENLNYSAQGLANTWSRFSVTGKRGGAPTVEAIDVQRQPQRIANIIYARRYGNGDEASGDGWKFRGKGGIQITFFSNHLDCGNYLGIDLIAEPMRLVEPAVAVQSPCWYWKVKGLDRFDDDGDAKAETRLINGGDNGLDDRQELLDSFRELLGA